jgi:tetratricopeptide (TPR) repeat protein
MHVMDMEKPAELTIIPLDDDEIEIANGGIRKLLGLETAHLRLCLDLARSQMRRGAHDEAFRTYCALVLCEPCNVDFQIGLANCAHEIGQHELALQAASAAIALAPKNPRGYFLSGRACFALAHYREAIEDLSAALTHGRAADDRLVVTEATKFLRLAEAKQE